MTGLVEIVLQVAPEIAERIQESGLAEIALRDGFKRFDVFAKALLANPGKAGEEINKAVSAMNDIAGRFIQLDDIGKQLNNINALQYLNIGLGVANLAVSVAGFVMIRNKLNELSGQISAQSKTINALKNMKEGDILQEYRKLSSKFSDYTALIGSHGVEVSREKMMTWLEDAESFIGKLIFYVGKDAMETEWLLKMIFTLLPAYTAMLNTFERSFFFETGKHFVNLDARKGLYTELMQDAFVKKVEEYLFLGKVHFRDVVQSVQAQNQIVQENLTQVEDEEKLLTLAGSEESYRKLKRGINLAVKEILEREASKAENAYGVSQKDCIDIAERFCMAEA